MIRTLARAVTMALVALGVASAMVIPAAAAVDASAPPTVGIAPADRPGDWYDLQIDPGASEHLSVEVANHGQQALEVASYPADAYTLVNGGMGVGLRDEPPSGTGSWLDHAASVVELDPGGAVRRTVTVTVPDGTPPGQYLAALVVENARPIRTEGELTMDQIVRHAMAINITVPGPAAPALTIGHATHTDAGGRSVVAIEIDNPGNRHLEPGGTLTLTDQSGSIVARHDVTVDSIYAGTTTQLELPLDTRLPAGTYTISAELTDTQYDLRATATAGFDVAAPEPTGSAVPGLDRLNDIVGATGVPRAILFGGATLVLVLSSFAVVRLRRRRDRATAADTSPAVDPERAATPWVAAAVTSSGRPLSPVPHGTGVQPGQEPAPIVPIGLGMTAQGRHNGSLLFTARPPARRRRLSSTPGERTACAPRRETT